MNGANNHFDMAEKVNQHVFELPPQVNNEPAFSAEVQQVIQKVHFIMEMYHNALPWAKGLWQHDIAFVIQTGNHFTKFIIVQILYNQKKCCSDVKSEDSVRLKFFTWHENTGIIDCAKLWPGVGVGGNSKKTCELSNLRDLFISEWNKYLSMYG